MEASTASNEKLNFELNEKHKVNCQSIEDLKNQY